MWHFIDLQRKKYNSFSEIVTCYSSIPTNYDHLLDISDGSKTLVDIAKKSSTRNIYEVVKLTAPIQVGYLPFSSLKIAKFAQNM